MSSLEKQLAYLPKMLSIFGIIAFFSCMFALIVNVFDQYLEDWQLNAVFFYAVGYWFGQLRLIVNVPDKSQ